MERMAACLVVQVLALVVMLSPARVSSLFEDQVGNYDWYRRNVGAVSYISVDQSPRSGRGVVVASETGVLAVLDPQDGSLSWRQLFEPGSSGAIDVVLRSRYGSLLTVSRHGQLLRSWDLESGQLKYEVATSLPPPAQRSFPLDQSWRPGGVQATLAGKKGGVVVVASGSKVTGFVARSGEQKWTFSVRADNEVCAAYGREDGVYVLSTGGGDLVISRLNLSTGVVIETHLIPDTQWTQSDASKCLLTEHHLWCVDETHLHSFLLTGAPTLDLQSFPLHTLLPPLTPTTLLLVPAQDPNEVWLRSDHTHWLLRLQDDDLTSVDEMVGVVLVDGDVREGKVWSDVRLEAAPTDALTVTHRRAGVRKVGVVYSLDVARGKPVRASMQLYAKTDQSVGFMVAVVMEDDSILMFGSNAAEGWVQEAGLGTITTLQFLDLPADQPAMVESFLEKTRGEVNPVQLALLRWQLQAQLFKEFLANLQRRNIVSLLSTDNTRLVRDQFSTRKMIVAITARGKVYGLDSNDGGVVWQQFFPWLLPLSGDFPPLLFILRSTSHPLHPPLAVLIGRSKTPSCPALCLVAFNPLTGSPEGAQPTLCLPELAQVHLLTKEDRNHTKILLLLTSKLEVISFPSSPEVTSHLTELEEQLFFFVANKQEGRIDGYYINNERTPSAGVMTFHTSHLWHLAFPRDTERIVSVISKPVNELVSAVGRSRLDRSIQYKYLNPNLVSVVTESTDPIRPAISIYLVDTVTGGVIFHTTHKAAVTPVHLVHSENWIVYQFLNSKLRRHELVVLELYEKDSNMTRTVWSSVTPPPPPEVLSQAYAVPTSFVTMTTTQTRRGITAKSILVGLMSGHIAAIPKTVLDPRREVEPSDEMKQANLPPYVPKLAINPIVFINYNQTVGALRNIYSTSSGLESTSLVLGCGLDLYFTRVLPSKQFDLLAVDFDYKLIAVVLVGMVTATVVLSKMSARKSLQLLWK